MTKARPPATRRRSTPDAARPRVTGRNPLLVVLSGPSGAGKTTLCRNLLAADPGVTRAVTCTTRSPRPGEREGVDYHFLTPAAFERGVAAGDFLEHAVVHGQRYGTWKHEVLRRLRTGRDVLLNVDVQGANAVRAAARAHPRLQGAVITVFLQPPTIAELERRLRGRNSDSPAVMRQRLAAAEQEMAEAPRFDHQVRSGAPADDLRRLQAILQAARKRADRPGAGRRLSDERGR